MEVQLINKELLKDLHQKAAESDRLRQNFDLRTTPADGSQRMLNALEVGTKVPVHRHLKSSETVICLEGCLDWVFYAELPNMDAGGPIHDGEVVHDESCFVETARFRVVRERGCMGYRFLLPHGIVSLCMNVVLSLRPKMERIGNNPIITKVSNYRRSKDQQLKIAEFQGMETSRL